MALQWVDTTLKLSFRLLRKYLFFPWCYTRLFQNTTGRKVFLFSQHHFLAAVSNITLADCIHTVSFTPSLLLYVALRTPCLIAYHTYCWSSLALPYPIPATSWIMQLRFISAFILIGRISPTFLCPLRSPFRRLYSLAHSFSSPREMAVVHIRFKIPHCLESIIRHFLLGYFNQPSKNLIVCSVSGFHTGFGVLP